MSKKIHLLSTLIVLFYLFSYSFCQASNEDITKLMSCMNIISIKNKGQPQDVQKYLLKCFITITDEEAKEVIVSVEQGIDPLEQEEIDKLTDISTLSGIPQNDLEEHLSKLRNTINAFKKLQDKFKSEKNGDTKDYNQDDEEYRKAHPSRGNALGAFMKKLTGLLKTINSMGNFVIAIIFIYFGYILLGNCRRNQKKKKKNKEKNMDNKDKNKKKKKNE